MSFRESIEWIEVSERLPNDDETVLIKMPESDEPVWLGWHDDQQWYSVDGAEMEGVTAWAAMPSGEAS